MNKQNTILNNIFTNIASVYILIIPFLLGLVLAFAGMIGDGATSETRYIPGFILIICVFIIPIIQIIIFILWFKKKIKLFFEKKFSISSLIWVIINIFIFCVAIFYCHKAFRFVFPVPEKKPPLIEAIMKHDVDKIRYLLKKPKIVLDDDILQCSIWHCLSYEGINLLIDKGAKIDSKNMNMGTPLMVAIDMAYDGRNGYGGRKEPYKIIKLLISKGANIYDKNRGITLLHVAVILKDIDFIEILLSKGFDINAKTDGYEVTPLMNATYHHNLDLIKYLVSKGADITAISLHDGSVLHIAASSCYGLKILKYFIELGLDVNIKNRDQETPLYSTIYNGEYANAVFLIDQGADLNCKNYKGSSFLMRACYSEKFNMVKLFVSKGVDINAKDNSGKTALDYANDTKDKEIINYLISNGAKSGITFVNS